MFLKFASVLADHGLDPNDCFKFHPQQLLALQEAVWELWRRQSAGASPIVTNPGLGKLRADRDPNSVAVAEPLRGLMRSLDRGIPSDSGTRDLGNDTFLLAAEA